MLTIVGQRGDRKMATTSIVIAQAASARAVEGERGAGRVDTVDAVDPASRTAA